ncbi:DEAD-box ATP-dependent RNA helicase 13 [Ziziphus jujuba]|uniref:DEAD-box ATP-dependent RNA helicase 13 n=1 Tax=Ziziphus jujuba TaxID=326968 RepID=A0A6P4AGS1_ZIZJJ|nr:DEAD-box ATP-dependent RNA helicase 13 [Ziziphus jujuba]
MASKPISESSKKKRIKRKRTLNQDAELEQLDSLPWNPSLSGEDPFSLFIGSNELEGGFLSLEEIDEVDYGLEFPKPEIESGKKKSEPSKKSKKRKSSDVDGNGNDGIEAKAEEKLEENENVKSEKKKKRKKKKKVKEVKKIEDVEGSDGEEIEAEVEKEKDGNLNIEQKRKKGKKKKVKESQKKEEPPAVSNSKDDVEEEAVDETEYYAWNELRLHPLIMKSIYRLGFKEPTPIQKACVPAAAHQGKDVIGAAETGSGKTLAFGLPIFQRLIEEHEKAARMLEEKGEEAEKFAPKGLLRALIITPTRELALQVTDHLKAVAKGMNVRVIPIVGGMSTEKQERLLKSRPEIIVGTPGRLWELMSGGDKHLVELHSLSFFVLDEADRMIENGHFRELQSIVDMLPVHINGSIQGHSQNAENCNTVSSVQRKKRQTFVFSATIALSADFRKKLKRGALKLKKSLSDGLNSIETLSERAGMRDNVAIIDLTNASILANKLEESFIECNEEDKDAYLYYILSVHGQGRTIVFCTSVAALRHISSVLRILAVNVWTLHAQMQQRARLKAIDRFRGNEHGILVATDVAARGLDIPGVRTVVHYQLPHSAEVYVHRSGRTARASADGCSIALISPNETTKFASLCKSFSKESFQRFPLDSSYMPAVMKRLSLARQIDKISRKDSKENAQKSWFERNAESVELLMDDDESDEEKVKNHKQKKVISANLKKLQQELKTLLSHPLQPQTFSRRYLAGAGVSPLVQHQFEELAKQKLGDTINSGENKRRKLVVIGQDCVEPLQALRSAGQQVHMDVKEMAEKRRNMVKLKKKRKAEKKRLKDQRRKQRRKLKGAE